MSPPQRPPLLIHFIVQFSLTTVVVSNYLLLIVPHIEDPPEKEMATQLPYSRLENSMVGGLQSMRGWGQGWGGGHRVRHNLATKSNLQDPKTYRNLALSFLFTLAPQCLGQGHLNIVE